MTMTVHSMSLEGQGNRVGQTRTPLDADVEPRGGRRKGTDAEDGGVIREVKFNRSHL